MRCITAVCIRIDRSPPKSKQQIGAIYCEDADDRVKSPCPFSLSLHPLYTGGEPPLSGRPPTFRPIRTLGALDIMSRGHRPIMSSLLCLSFSFTHRFALVRRRRLDVKSHYTARQKLWLSMVFWLFERRSLIRILPKDRTPPSIYLFI